MSDISTMECTYGAQTYTVTVDMRKSQYRGKIQPDVKLEYFPYYSTIDDLTVIDIARQLDEQLMGRRDRIKASVILALVQQNIQYVSDEERFGKDVWEIPAYTLEHRMADCDGMTSLFTSIAYNVGLDVVSVLIIGHMCSAVCMEGIHGKMYDYAGKRYYHIETTDEMPIVGRFWDNRSKKLYISPPAPPSNKFIETLAFN